MDTHPAYRSLMDYALRLLGRKTYTVHELRQKLEKRLRVSTHESPGSVVDSVLARLDALNLLSDQTYCARWVEERSRLRPRGRYGLVQELRRKGISSDVIEQFWESDTGQQFDETAMAKKVLSKQAARLNKKHSGQDLRQKLYLHMMSRGFSHDVARHTLEAWEGSLDKADASY